MIVIGICRRLQLSSRWVPGSSTKPLCTRSAELVPWAEGAMAGLGVLVTDDAENLKVKKPSPRRLVVAKGLSTD